MDHSHVDLTTFDFEGFMNEFEIWNDFVPSERTGSIGQELVKPEPEHKPCQITKRSATKRVVKSLKKKRDSRAGQKIQKVCTTTCTTQLKFSLYEHRFQVVAPNMSLKTTDSKLFAFPRFNKCDALLFFPSTMAGYINSGDMSSLSELFGSYLPSSCPVIMTDVVTRTYPPSQFVEFIDTMNDFASDMILCMHFTKVVDSEIHSKLYFKFTDNPVLYAACVRAVANTPFAPMFPPCRVEQFKIQWRIDAKSPEEQRAYLALIESEKDLQVYGRMDMRIRIDEQTKRVEELNLVTELTSVKLC